MLENILIFFGVIAVFFIGSYVLGGGASRKATLERVEKMKNRKAPASKAIDMSLRRKTNESKGLSYWLMKPLPDFKKLGERLERAGKAMTPKQFVFRRAMTVAGFVMLFALFGKNILLGFFLGIIIGVWIPFKLVDRSIRKQAREFLRLFPDGIDLIVRGLRSGLPVSESMVIVSTEVPAPVGTFFSNISATMKLGVPLEKALQETARKLDLTEFNFFTTSIILQRETGGNLAEILNNLSEVLRNRFIMRMKIKALSSEARASGIIIGALPFVVFGLVSVVSPDYMTPLYTDYRGNICLAVAAGMMGFGGYIMNKMTQFEI